MTPDLLKYINSLRYDLSVRLWLYVINNASKNGTVNVIFKDLCIEYKLTLNQVKQLFNFEEAAKLDLIKVLIKKPDFVSLNLKNKTTKVVEPKIKQSGTTGAVSVTPSPINTPVVVTPKDEQGLIIGALGSDYMLSATLRQKLIGDYCEFYKGVIVSRAALAGNLITNPANPKLTKHDVGAFAELTKHLNQNGFKTEQAIRYAMVRIYQSWHLMPPNVQNYFTPAQINHNWNHIYGHMVQIGKPNKKQTKKDDELTEKLNRADGKDYSHLANKG